MSFQLGIGSLGGTVSFQVRLCTPLRTMGGGSQKWTRANKEDGEGKNSGILSEYTFWMSPKIARNRFSDDFKGDRS